MRSTARIALACVAALGDDLDAELVRARAQVLLGELPDARTRLERAVTRWPTVVELQARLAAVLPDRARAAALLSPLSARGALSFELRDP